MKSPLILFLFFISLNGHSQNYPDDCLDSLKIPGVYTSDGDGVDEGFFIDFTCPPEKFEFTIYNKWGSLIYQTEDYQFIWKGEKEDGDNVTEGQYIYVLKYTFNGADFSKTGSVNVLI